MPLNLKVISISSNIFFKASRGQLRNFTRALTQEHVTTLDQETLTGRILLYLNIDNNKRQDATKTLLETLNTFRQNLKNLRKFNTTEIIHFSDLLSGQEMEQHQLLSTLKTLDTEFYLRLPELSVAEILKILGICMKITPNRITELQFYKHAIKDLFNALHNLDKKELLQLIFYVGLGKKNLAVQTMLRQCLKVMNHRIVGDLTNEELCIVCNATFKTSTKITSKYLLETVKKHINENLIVLKDSALFVTLVKTIRHNRFQDDNLLSTISCALLFNNIIPLYSFATICHIMALYADYFYYEEELFKVFTRKCIEELAEKGFISSKLHLTKQFRGKDIKRFLWVMSMFADMKLISQCDIKDVIIPKLTERMEAKEFEQDVDSLIDIILYLWMLGYRPYELVPSIVTEQNVQLLKTKSRTNLRLNLLLQCIFLEDPQLLKKIAMNPINVPNNVFSKYQLQKRPAIQRVLNILRLLTKKTSLSKFEFTQEVPHLNIIGITGYNNNECKAVYVELLDDYTRLRNIEEDIPVGLMALKLRLLEHSEEGVLMVSQREVEEMTDLELSEHLLEEIKFVC